MTDYNLENTSNMVWDIILFQFKAQAANNKLIVYL